MSLEEDLQILKKLENDENLDSQIEIFSILKRRCESLVSNIPNNECTPHCWVIQKTINGWENDVQFIESALPSHNVIKLNGPIREK
jgi:hypothetical protein